MVIKNAAFVTSLERYGNYPGIGLPEIAVAGKSNVGKSSMINKLCMRNKLAKVSATPGKTRLLNIFKINEDFHLVDLPGYGFAKVSKAEQLKWSNMMEGYFADSGLLCHVLHLVDLRHDPTGEDRGMNEFLRATGIPFTILATKADKLSRAQRHLPRPAGAAVGSDPVLERGRRRHGKSPRSPRPRLRRVRGRRGVGNGGTRERGNGGGGALE